jgi:dTDP-4-amino-4,6-dideoxygalactose transaminase
MDTAGLSPGDGVVISALSPALYSEILREKGLEPLVVDVDPDSGAMALDAIDALPSRPKAILLHYTLGFMPDLQAVSELGIPMIEDLSQGFGGNFGTRRCGTYGEVSVLSLEAEGIVTCAGGGAVLVKDRRKARELRSHPTALRHRLADMNAYLGLAQMRQIESFIAARKEIAQLFSRSLMRSGHKPLIQKGEAENIYYSFPVVLDRDIQEVIQYARKKNVETALAFSDAAISKLEEDGEYPNARSIALRCLLFPLYPMLGKRNAEFIGKLLSTLP